MDIDSLIATEGIDRIFACVSALSGIPTHVIQTSDRQELADALDFESLVNFAVEHEDQEPDFDGSIRVVHHADDGTVFLSICAPDADHVISLDRETATALGRSLAPHHTHQHLN